MSGTDPEAGTIKLEPAYLKMPDLPVGKMHFKTSDFLPGLLAFQSQVGEIIARLQKKADNEAFDIKFQFDFTCNSSTETSLITDHEKGTLKLTCYCNGGG